MRRLCTLLFAAVFALAAHASVTNVYVAQTAQGAGTGADCADAAAVTFFNSSGNWGAGSSQIGPGSTVHLCGTITTELTAEGSGTSGSPVTIYFESGAKLSQSEGNLLNISNRGYITVDGGTNGIVENTLNGSAGGTCPGGACTSQVATQAILANNASNIEVKNLTCQNMYVHSLPGDSAIDQTESNCYYANGVSGTITLDHDTLENVGWAILLEGYSGTPTMNIYDDTFADTDHGVAAGDPSVNFTLNIYQNTFGSTANWDTTSDSYHHDGIHIYSNSSFQSGVHVNIWNNIFDGNWGTDNTAQLFTENNPPNLLIYNNAFIGYPGGYMNNGYMNIAGANAKVLNNTFVGQGVTLSGCMELAGANVTYENNVSLGCNTLISLSGSGTFAAGGLNNNIYAQGASGGNDYFYYNGSTSNSISAWQGWTGQDANSSYQTSAKLSSTGIPQSGSPVIGAGANLTSLCSGQPNPGIGALCEDAAGNPRPSTGAWDIGAYQYASGTPTVDTPTVSPTAGTYTAKQAATIINGTSGAVNCFTIDNTTPAATTAGACSTGFPYTSSIPIYASLTLKALGTHTGYNNSAVASNAYTITVPTPTFTPTGGTYSSPQNVALADTGSGANLFYTTDGSAPTLASTPYTSAINVPSSLTLKALGFDLAVNQSNLDDTLTSWSTCILPGCSPGGTGTPTSTSQTINNSSPSKDGEAMLISQTTSSNYTNALWTYKATSGGNLITCDTCTNVIADFWFYPVSSAHIGSLEFDSFIFASTFLPGGTEFMYGHQWNAQDGHWQIWNQLAGMWVDTAITAPPNYNTYNHLQFIDRRNIADTNSCSGYPCESYVQMILNGVTYNINMNEPSSTLPVGWASTVGFQFQLDTDGTISGSTTLSEYLDEATLRVGGDPSSTASATYTINTLPPPIKFSGGVKLSQGKIN